MKAKPASEKSKTPPARSQVKIQDIKPQKDVKGGRRRTADPCEGGE